MAWVRSVDESASWAALDRLVTLDDLARWHAEPDVVPFAFVEPDDAGVDRLVAYGELWEDRELDEAELARLVVDPAVRGRGVGRALARALADEARRRGFTQVWLRVVAENAAARRAYEAAGFARATPEEEAAFNTGQPREYVWMRDARPRAPAEPPDSTRPATAAPSG